jgi:hypothetical protein
MTTELPYSNINPAQHTPRIIPFLLREFAEGTPHFVAGSIRVPVTPENRSLLRGMRAAELEAWEQSSGSTWAGVCLPGAEPITRAP